MSEKIFRDTRIQISLLESRGIIIKNKRYAKQVIRNTNYYNLINGYKLPFIMTSTPCDKYLNGTTFEEIYSLYEFDRKLRIITLEYILEVEKQAKALISYCFSKEHGHKDYLKYENFESMGLKKYKQVSDILCAFYKKISSNIDKDHSVTHYVNGKNYIPLWVLVNTISMGEISKFYSNMHQRNREDVARRMKWGVRENQLSSCLFFLSSIRNRCAHDELLYSYQSYVKLCNNNFQGYFKIKHTNNYFSVLIAFKILLSKNRYDSYHDQIECLFNELDNKLHTINVKKIQNIMGFPHNWKGLRFLK